MSYMELEHSCVVLASHTVSCSFENEQLETLTAKTQHAVALALTVGLSSVEALCDCFFLEIVKIVFLAMWLLSDTH